jgi:hypothetical protein
MRAATHRHFFSPYRYDTMKKLTFAIALAIASLGAAQAQTDAPAPAEKQMRFLVGAGLTFGGDKLATARFVNGDEYNLHAGSIFAMTAGIDYRVTEQFSFQGTIGYHVDDATAKNGSIKFQRFPIELLAYYHLSPAWRIGGGARYLTNAKLTSSGAADIGDYEFKNTLSGVVEGEYLIGRHAGVKVRYVVEKLEEKHYGDKFKANHLGVFGIYYF